MYILPCFLAVHTPLIFTHYQLRISEISKYHAVSANQITDTLHFNDKDDYPATCNSVNVIYFPTCSTLLLQYIRETAQQLNVRFGKHRDCFKGKVNSASFGGFPIVISKFFVKALNMQFKSLKSGKDGEVLEEGL